MLEARCHEANSFITLTYDSENCPKDGSLQREDVQKFFKKLRKAYVANPLRFFAVGEYGDNTWRPHYHLAVFGYPSCHFGRSRYAQGVKDCCPACDLVRDKWKFGHVDLGTLTQDSAQYIAGYCTKKLTTPDNDRNREYRETKGLLLNGRYREFSASSLKPGIGAPYAEVIAQEIKQNKHGDRILNKFGDVPSSLLINGKEWPLDRYMKDKIRDALGWEKTELLGRCVPTQLQEKKEMLSLQKVQKSNEEMDDLEKKYPDVPRWKLKQDLLRQKDRNREARHKIYNKRSI
ncbi:MAG: hypothetical protein OXQ96_01445 [Alphaproteobacteria bacterium]|nr:hypothetical protein [Alphaproteobacteria bacterium]